MNRKNEDLDREIDDLIDNMYEINNSNTECLHKGNKVLDKIEQKRLPQIDNEIKKSGWFGRGINSTGSWIKNLFKGPSLKKTNYIEKNEPDSNLEEINHNLDSVEKLRKTNSIMEKNQSIVKDQTKRVEKINTKIKKQKEEVKKINDKIKL